MGAAVGATYLTATQPALCTCLMRKQLRDTEETMPRPNIDIPNLIKGGVKDYARREDISQDEAYTELLRLGLEEEGILTEYFPDED